MSSETAPKTSLRQATPADLDDVVRLLSARDGIERNSEVVRKYLWGLEPANFLAWLAFSGDRPVGITSLYLRDMSWPQESGEPQTLQAGYWSHLYVEPAFRKQMIYPQLVMSMLRGMKSAGLDIIFTATRQPDVADGHQKLGFKLVGKMPLRIRPLRPFRLLAKHKGMGFLAPFAVPLDGLYRLSARRKISTSLQVEEIPLDSSELQQVVALLNDHSQSTVRQIWDVDQIRRRFRTTLDGTSYRITAVKQDGQVVAALLMAIADRGNNIRAGVLLDLAAKPDASKEVLESLLGEGEFFAHQQGAEIMLSLEPSLQQEPWGSTYANYLLTRSETYHILVYPKAIAESPNLATSLDNWQFTFADHDAF